MNLSRFEQVVNDSSHTRDAELTEVLQELLKEHKDIKSKTAPSVFNSFRKKMSEMREGDFFLTILALIPLSLALTTFAFVLISGLLLGGQHEGYYLRETSGCVQVANRINWGEDTDATGCLQDPLDAVKILQSLNGGTNANSSFDAGSGNTGLQGN